VGTSLGLGAVGAAPSEGSGSSESGGTVFTNPLDERLNNGIAEVKLGHFALAVSDAGRKLRVFHAVLPLGAGQILGADHRAGRAVAFSKWPVALVALGAPGKLGELCRFFGGRGLSWLSARLRGLPLRGPSALFFAIVVLGGPLRQVRSRGRPVAGKEGHGKKNCGQGEGVRTRARQLRDENAGNAANSANHSAERSPIRREWHLVRGGKRSYILEGGADSP